MCLGRRREGDADLREQLRAEADLILEDAERVGVVEALVEAVEERIEIRPEDDVARLAQRVREPSHS